MKKISINLLGILLFTTMLYSCGKNAKNNTESNNNEDTSTVVLVEEKENEATEVVDEIGFSKFEHYATILTKKDLIAQFGQANLRDLTKSYAEGSVVKEATILTNPQNGQVIEFIWDDDNSTTSWIEAYYKVYDENLELLGTQEIEAENGLSIGMSLSKLKEWNGDDFKFSGFAWDFAGGIYREEGSKISGSPIEITLDILSYEGADFAMGDVQLSTDDSRLDNVKIIVAGFLMHIE
ncbi:MAG: hypothetical protein DRI95_14620 [Bacteroidetes bacterium]|nr:MAG: hypothetical protein DRI95_14620 [Bacteroidota bacterium]